MRRLYEQNLLLSVWGRFLDDTRDFRATDWSDAGGQRTLVNRGAGKGGQLRELERSA